MQTFHPGDIVAVSGSITRREALCGKELAKVERWRVFCRAVSPLCDIEHWVLIEDVSHAVFRNKLFRDTKVMLWPVADAQLLKIVTPVPG